MVLVDVDAVRVSHLVVVILKWAKRLSTTDAVLRHHSVTHSHVTRRHLLIVYTELQKAEAFIIQITSYTIYKLHTMSFDLMDAVAVIFYLSRLKFMHCNVYQKR